jgi:hypothetical protein
MAFSLAAPADVSDCPIHGGVFWIEFERGVRKRRHIGRRWLMLGRKRRGTGQSGIRRQRRWDGRIRRGHQAVHHPAPVHAAARMTDGTPLRATKMVAMMSFRILRSLAWLTFEAHFLGSYDRGSSFRAVVLLEAGSEHASRGHYRVIYRKGSA